MTVDEFYDKMGNFEKCGKFVGNIFGKTIKNPFRLLGYIIPFLFVGLLAFFYSFKDAVKKS